MIYVLNADELNEPERMMTCHRKVLLIQIYQRQLENALEESWYGFLKQNKNESRINLCMK